MHQARPQRKSVPVAIAPVDATAFKGLAFAALIVEAENLVHEFLVPAVARGKALPDQVGLVPEEFNVEHRRIIGTKTRAAMDL